MPIVFKPENHQYLSVGESAIDWISVTSLIGKLKQPFDAKTQATKSARNTHSKWYKMTTAAILAAWKAESTRAIRQGSWYHAQQENIYCSLETLFKHGKHLPVFKPQYDAAGNKIAPEQKLSEGVYPEHFMYLKSAGICGQSDLVEVADGKVHITDYKTNKEIKTTGYTNWEGITQKMKFPVSHLDDCHLKQYTLQLSLYLFMILKHNPRLLPGTLTLHHIQFEEQAEKDSYGYPVGILDSKGQPIVKAVVPYEVPYMREEVISVIHWLHDNKSKLLKQSTAA